MRFPAHVQGFSGLPLNMRHAQLAKTAEPIQPITE
jgi:hypothetical protein